MPSPGLTIVLALARRHRRGLAAIGAYLMLIALARLLIFEPGWPGRDNPGVFAVTTTVPLWMAFIYLVAIFSFGLSGDVAARQSMYPARLFALPVTTDTLAGSPMIAGSIAVATLWTAGRLAAPWPDVIAVPFIWPGLFAVVFLLWTQVLAWTGYGLPGLRIALAVLWLAAINAVVFNAVHFEVSEGVMLALLAPHVPLAWWSARRALARARRSDVPDWRGAFSWRGAAAGAARRRRPPFTSAARAQFWFEWRQHGRSLPVWVAIVLPFELALLFIAGADSPRLVTGTLAAILLTPPFLAAFTAPPVREAGGGAGLSTFAATRPLATITLAAARLKTALASTLVTWLVVFAVVPLALAGSGSWSVAVDRLRWMADGVGWPYTSITAVLVLAALMVSTWKQLVQAQTIGLAGHTWMVKASVLVRLSLLIAVVLLLDWVGNRSGIATLWSAAPWVLAGLALVKTGAAAWIATRLVPAGVLGTDRLVALAAGWLAAVLALYGVLVWLVSTPPLLPRYLPALIALFAVPVVRPAAALMTVAWSRHGGRLRHGAPHAAPGWLYGPRALALVLLLLATPGVIALGEAVAFAVSQRNNGTLISSGVAREYLLHVPVAYDGSRPVPLVISLHGAGGWPGLQRDVSGWNDLADEHGFLVVYPSAAGGRGPRVWTLGLDSGLIRDVRFIAELIDTLERRYHIDPARIYVDGLSAGGGMAFVLSCTLPDHLAAAGMVAAAHLLPWSWCPERRPIPLIAFHGTADRQTPYEGGISMGAPAPFPHIPTWIAEWAGRNRCASDPVETPVAPDVTRRAYRDCADEADVVLYTIHGGGHTWPGRSMPAWLGPSTGSLDATRETWDFFRAHRVSRADSAAGISSE
jgi:polyhydroxybutyrate depolymerase